MNIEEIASEAATGVVDLQRDGNRHFPEQVELIILSALHNALAKHVEAIDAAKNYINSNVCDPDTTEEMWDRYQRYEKAIKDLSK